MNKMTHITTYDIGDVLLVPFPFSDLSEVKQRPAMVINNKEHQRDTNHVICMVISSKEPKGKWDIRLEKWKEAGLLFPSIVKIGKVFSLDHSEVRKYLV
ncbi:type II toxin-antitoxin system PemK/MazF family toxin [Fodinisporobacter ferrooxydans]|uniref:Type II toxin-antitoxin system PemK/MazF family toxin n=1 Tax=Fodinisporobacter ferrooxydans TaxID=2901836 RepID=A0ABY4CSD9_9BACL|nr:type II toxin-antitoxin system PemK/MazF family toxin [Alicyclobacillaceae bacterium MYW30-H2]